MSARLPAGLEESDFETIEDAVLETARGRWFLREFARRARAADTSRLLDSISRIERMLGNRDPGLERDPERHAGEIEERRARLAEIAWMLRERGYDGDICALIEKEARALAHVAATMRGGGDFTRAASGETDTSRRIEAPRAIAAPLERALETHSDGDDDEFPPDEHAPEPPSRDLPLPAASANVVVEDWRETAARALAPIDRMTTRERLALCG